MKRYLFLINIVFLLIFSGCSKDDPTAPAPLPFPPSTQGAWSGSYSGGPPWTVNLTENDTQISGSGIIAGSLTYGVTGKNIYPQVTMTFVLANYRPFTFTGSFVNKSMLSGVLNGSGFVNANAVFNRL
jgi:hypothetical protein